jgi:ParB-like chromosome segregation protein Spo0J
MVPVSTVKPYPSNPIDHPGSQVDEIAASMDEFGFVNPILLDADGIIIAGHGRLEAAQKRGMKEVPVIRLKHLTQDQAKALRIADNSLPREARWNPDMLDAELAALRAVKFDLEPLGLEHIVLPEIEEVPEPTPPKPSRSKTTIFVSIANPQVEKARKVIVAALDKAHILHNL